MGTAESRKQKAVVPLNANGISKLKIDFVLGFSQMLIAIL